MASNLKERLAEQLKASMRAGEKDKLSFVRNLHAAIRKKEIDERVDLDDEAVIKIASSLIKQRQESIEQFKQGKREDLVAREEAELQFLQSFLPEQMKEQELRDLIDCSIAEAKAMTAKDIGQVMKLLLPKIQGRADGKVVNQLIREKLN